MRIGQWKTVVIGVALVCVACGKDRKPAPDKSPDAQIIDDAQTIDDACSELALWDWDGISTADRASRAQLTVDGTGVPHILFVTDEGSESTLNYATRADASSAWQFEKVASLPSEPTYATGVLTKPVAVGGELHALFGDDYSDESIHAFRTVDGWQTTPFPSSQFGMTSLGATPEGRVIAAYSDLIGLKLSTFDLGSWSEPETIETHAVEGGTRGTGAHPHPYEAGGQLNVLFTNASDELRLATRVGDVWSVEVVGIVGDSLAQGPMAAADFEGVAHVLFTSSNVENRQPLAHFSNESGEWKEEIVYEHPPSEQSRNEIHWFTSLAAAPGRLHATVGNMKGCEGGELLSRDGTTWSRQVFSADRFKYSSLALGPDGTLHAIILTDKEPWLFYATMPR